MKTAAILILLSAALGANALDDLACGSFGIYGQAVYLKPTNGDRVYTQQLLDGNILGDVRSKTVCPTYEWGFELGGVYYTLCHCFYAKILGGWTEFTKGDRTRGVTLVQLPLLDVINVNGQNLGAVTGDLKAEYWYVDARAGHYFTRGCGADIDAYLGVRYVNLCARLEVTAVGTANTVTAQEIRQRQRSEFSGAGPAIGLGGQFCAWGGFGVAGEIGAMAIIGTRKSSVSTFQSVAPASVNANEFQYDNCVSVVPALDMRAAVNWMTQWDCLRGGIEAGYKLSHYFKAHQLGISSANTTVVRDVGFAGPYIGLNLAY